MAARYERWTVTKQGRERGLKSGFYRIRSAGSVLVHAVRVNKDGDELDVKYEGDVLVEVEHMVSTDLLASRVPYKMSNHYGWLVKA